MNGSRSIEIGRDAAGNTIITGDGNVVVIEAVQRLAEPPAPVTALGPNPYQGLAAFDQGDAERFFGREALTDKLWSAFCALQAPPPGSTPLRLLAVFGPSGCGKSSLVRAGLLPELARRPLPG
ncbi:MAG: ATP-binding protein, partial [Chromatiaceae bacterium]